ncbi:MAG: acyl-CoA dehydrogenase family protein [Acidimicrobiales bacterium]
MTVTVRLESWQEELVAAVREYAQGVIRPAAARLESLSRPEDFPYDLMTQGSALGLKALALPRELGGREADMVTQCLVAAELAAGDVAVAYYFRHYWRFARLIPRLHPLLRDMVVQGIAGDERFVPASASTEDLAGSDNALPYDAPGHAAMLAARRSGEGWRLDGKKTMITNGGIASLYFVLARTDASKGIRTGATMFAVPATTPGLSTGPFYRKLGQRGSPQADIFFEGCEVPPHCALTQEGEGYAAAERGLVAANITNAALSLGVARAAYDEALEWCLDRVQGGVPIYKHQLVAYDLGSMRLEIEAVQSYLMHVASEYSSAPDFDPGLSWGVRVFAGETAINVTQKAMLLFGGRGIMEHYPVEKLARDALTLTHGNGTSRILTARLGTHRAEARLAGRARGGAEGGPGAGAGNGKLAASEERHG